MMVARQPLQAAKRLEIRMPLRIERDSWSPGAMLPPRFFKWTPPALLFWWKRSWKRRLSGLELRVPPVPLALVAAALMWCARSATPDLTLPFPSSLVFPVALALIGALTCLAGVVSFRRARTTVNPMKPDSTSALVVSGIYRYTRNPMYLGFLLILLACAAALANALALIALPVFVLYMNRFQISPEERVLDSRFAPEYAEYRARVRRWL
jgi:protein-S-isoprenylcysteine O-methyltransferase Ste14